ncbi:MAG: glutamine--fructose-6-phosphate transaminase (isomerizing), partial [Candidatus Omnitrophota bacterium]|nr:glutamine--fructose-6-phosphate transaminase (isomerizing) [Candidatus Omnitrophota bacterium]
SRVVPIPGTRAWLLEANSLYLCRWLRENIVLNKKEFLSRLGQLPKDEIAAFLKGLFDAEGCVNLNSHQISLCMTDRYLVRIAQLLLLKFDIAASFYMPKKVKSEWSQSYAILISNRRSFEKFIESINFTSEIKKERLHCLTSVNGKNGKCTVMSDEKVFYQPILGITQVKSDEEFLFDLEVEHPDASFIANGFVSHNSRWATHGVPSDINAHPHLDCKGKLAVVHNGIIENYLELKNKLIGEGHKFRSETDTEVIAHLIEKFYSGDIAEAVRRAVKLLRGSYAIVVIHKDEPQRMVGVRCDSPLIIGLGKNENFLASDVPAVLDHTKDVIYLNNHEIAVLTKDNVAIKDPEWRKISRKPSKIKWDISQAEKGGYKHFMLKEIFEQGRILTNILDERCKNGKIGFDELKISAAALKKIKRIAIVACGTAYHAGLAGKYMLEELAKIPCWVDVSSEFRYRNPLVDKETLMIVISQSGETADTLAALREAKRHGAKVLAICNVLGSSIARESDGVIYTHAGPEIAVASTKAYTAQLSVFYLLTMYLSGIRNTVAPAKLGVLLKELKRVPELMEELLAEYKPDYNLLAAYAEGFKKYYHEKHNKTFFLYLARNINYPNALEGALKLKEIAYISAEGYPAGEMKHGPIALIDENPWVVCIAVKSKTYEKMISNIQEIKARNGIVIAISTEGDKEILHHNINYLIEIPKVEELFSPLLVAIPLQLLAYYVARAFGYDIDQPRNLAKSVTVE